MLPQEENVCFQGTFNVAEMPGEGIINCELQLDNPEGTGGSAFDGMCE